MMALFIGPKASGALWNVGQVLGFLAILGFTAVAWDIFKEAGWWEPVALASSVVGILATVPYALAAPSSVAANDQLSLVINTSMHDLGSAAVIALLHMQPAEHWLAGRLSSGGHAVSAPVVTHPCARGGGV